MATLALSTVGGIIAGGAGGLLGTITGNYIDHQIFGLNKFSEVANIQNINNIKIQNATYNKIIPIIFGSMKVAENIIWALPIKKITVIDDNEDINVLKPRKNFNNIKYILCNYCHRIM